MLSALIAFLLEKLRLWKALQLQYLPLAKQSLYRCISLPVCPVLCSKFKRELSKCGTTCTSACMNENVCVKSVSEARSNFGGVSGRSLTESECCREVSLIAAQSYQLVDRMDPGRSSHKLLSTSFQCSLSYCRCTIQLLRRRVAAFLTKQLAQ